MVASINKCILLRSDAGTGDSVLARMRTHISSFFWSLGQGRGPRPGDMPRVRQMTAKSVDEVDLSQFFATPADVLYDNSCDSCMCYYFKPYEDPMKRYSREKRDGTLEVCRSIDSLYLQATCLRPILQRKLEQLVGACSNACRIGGSLQTPLKDPARAVQKALRVYGNDCSLLIDICREIMVFNDLPDLVDMLHRLQEDAEVMIVRVKNRLNPEYDSALSSGYRDVMINIKLQTRETIALNVHHHSAELQLVLRAVYERRTEGLNQVPEDSARGLREGEASSSRYNRPRPGFTGHMNYVLWRDLHGL